jgi:hypothetical protein
MQQKKVIIMRYQTLKRVLNIREKTTLKVGKLLSYCESNFQKNLLSR